MTDAQERLEEVEAELARAAERIQELERTVEALRDTKDDFLALMSHELRTPLNHIIGFSEVLAMGMAGTLNEEQQRQVEMIARSGRYLLLIVNDVQDLVRFGAGTIAVEDNIFEAGEVLDAAIEMCQLAAVEKGLSLINGGGSSLGVRSDRRRVRQVLFNLVSNAIKFTAEGSVTIRALAHGSMVRFEVQDTGYGMTEEELDVAFGEFVQMPSREVDLAKSPGAGLGLAISRRFVNLLGGTLHARSQVGVGSVFYFDVPADEG